MYAVQVTSSDDAATATVELIQEWSTPAAVVNAFWLDESTVLVFSYSVSSARSNSIASHLLFLEAEALQSPFALDHLHPRGYPFSVHPEADVYLAMGDNAENASPRIEALGLKALLSLMHGFLQRGTPKKSSNSAMQQQLDDRSSEIMSRFLQAIGKHVESLALCRDSHRRTQLSLELGTKESLQALLAELQCSDDVVPGRKRLLQRVMKRACERGFGDVALEAAQQASDMPSALLLSQLTPGQQHQVEIADDAIPRNVQFVRAALAHNHLGLFRMLCQEHRFPEAALLARTHSLGPECLQEALSGWKSLAADFGNNKASPPQSSCPGLFENESLRRAASLLASQIIADFSTPNSEKFVPSAGTIEEEDGDDDDEQDGYDFNNNKHRVRRPSVANSIGATSTTTTTTSTTAMSLEVQTAGTNAGMLSDDDDADDGMDESIANGKVLDKDFESRRADYEVPVYSPPPTNLTPPDEMPLPKDRESVFDATSEQDVTDDYQDDEKFEDPARSGTATPPESEKPALVQPMRRDNKDDVEKMMETLVLQDLDDNDW